MKYLDYKMSNSVRNRFSFNCYKLHEFSEPLYGTTNHFDSSSFNIKSVKFQNQQILIFNLVSRINSSCVHCTTLHMSYISPHTSPTLCNRDGVPIYMSAIYCFWFVQSATGLIIDKDLFVFERGNTWNISRSTVKILLRKDK